jgi:hypothetical protein
MSLGLIPLDRLILIPPRFHDQHEFCFFVHDQMVSLLREGESHRITDVSFRLKDTVEANAVEHSEDILSFLIQSGRTDVARRVSVNQTSLALYADLLHFVFEALRAFEKRKFVVAFTLLRKPLRQNLLFATWICADEVDFFDKLLRSPADHMEENNFPAARRLELIATALKNTRDSSCLDANLIYSIAFDKNFESGFAPLFDKAAHLVTSRGRLMKTEELNLNFIFKDLGEDDLFDIVYLRLAYLLIYLLFLQIELFSRMRGVTEHFLNWTRISTLGAFLALFVKGRSPLIDGLNKAFAEFLMCPHCKAPVKIKKFSAARFFVSQQLHCSKCGNDHEFPLFWLLSKCDLSL